MGRDKTFADLLQQCMDARGVKQAELARKTGFPSTTIGRYRRGYTRPQSEEIVGRLANGLGLSDIEKIDFLAAAGFGLPVEFREVKDSLAVKTLLSVLNTYKDVEWRWEWKRQILEEEVIETIELWENISVAFDKLHNRKWGEAITICERQNEQGIGDPHVNLYLLDVLGTAHFHLGLLDSAEGYYQQAEAWARMFMKDAEHSYQASEVYTHLSDVCRNRGQWEKALKYIDKSESIIEHFEVDDKRRLYQKGRLLRKRANLYLFRGMWKTAQNILQESLRCFKDLESVEYEESKTHAALGWAYDLRGESEQANKEFKITLSISEQRKDDYNIMKACRFLGFNLMETEQKEEAKSYLVQANDLMQKLGARTERGMILLGLANLDLLNDLENDARKKFEQSLHSSRSLGDKMRVALALNDQGNLFVRLGDYKRADSCFDQAKRTFAELNNPYYELASMINSAALQLKQSKFSSADRLAEEVERKSRGMQDSGLPKHLARAQVVRAAAKIGLGKFAEAQKYYEAALEHGLQHNKYLFREIAGQVSDEIQRLKKTKEKQAVTLRDSLEQAMKKHDTEPVIAEFLENIGNL